MSWDLVIRGGRVVDGTGMRSFTADVAIKDGRIARIAEEFARHLGNQFGGFTGLPL